VTALKYRHQASYPYLPANVTDPHVLSLAVAGLFTAKGLRPGAEKSIRSAQYIVERMRKEIYKILSNRELIFYYYVNT
jgi:hypothetical protein